MALELHLLGHPVALVDGDPVRLRGTKAWALLGYLLRSDWPVARARLARVLFADAADPDGALRWNLSHLRRTVTICEIAFAIPSVAAPEDAHQLEFGDGRTAPIDPPDPQDGEWRVQIAICRDRS